MSQSRLFYGQSRRTIAKHVAGSLVSGDKAVIDSLAALIVETNAHSQIEYLVRDIEYEISRLVNHKVADITVAIQPGQIDLTKIKQKVAELINADSVEVRLHHDPSLIAGILVETADERIDTSVAQKISRLRNLYNYDQEEL